MIWHRRTSNSPRAGNNQPRPQKGRHRPKPGQSSDTQRHENHFVRLQEGGLLWKCHQCGDYFAFHEDPWKLPCEGPKTV